MMAKGFTNTKAKVSLMKRKRGFTPDTAFGGNCHYCVIIGDIYPALIRALEQGKRAACLHNLIGLTLAWIMYVGDRDQRTIDYGNQPWAVSESAGGIDKN